ncbi:MAG: hypothetical protein JSR86_02315 [Proteobacteria bacterium]|nr:hypothetical protein [Pseudomonadota bacterium]
MSTCSTEFLPLPLYRRSAVSRLAGSIRYGGVLAVWLALFMVRPGLALDIWRHRRPDSPIRRWRAA